MTNVSLIFFMSCFIGRGPNDVQSARLSHTLRSSSLALRVIWSQEEATPSMRFFQFGGRKPYDCVLTPSRFVALAWKDPQNITEELKEQK